MSAQRLTAALVAVREARAMLERASAECWQNGDAATPGPVHWSAAVPAARSALNRALVELETLARERQTF